MNSDQDVSPTTTAAPQSGNVLSPTRRGKGRASGITLQVRRLIARQRKGLTDLQDISLYIPPSQLVAVAGPDRSGKTALLASLAGIRPPSEGQIQINDVGLYPNRKVFSPRIGYVSHQNTVHPVFTVREVLTDAARLRMPRSAKTQERKERVDEVIQQMGLENESNVQASRLSPAGLWRLRTAVELIANPVLLLVDEPDETPDLSAELALTERLRALTRQGLTAFIVTRSAKAARLADKVVLLAPGGKLTWFGPPEEALEYFSGLRPIDNSSPNGGFSQTTETPADTFGFEDIFALLENPDQQNLAERFKTQPEFEKYIGDPLSGKRPDLQEEDHPLERFRGKENVPQPPALIRQIGGVQQFFFLLGRSFRLLLRDKQAAMLAFGLPLVLALGLFLMAAPLMYDPISGDPSQVAFVTAFLVFLSMMAGTFAFMREVVKEKAAYRRERQVNLKIMPYVLAKAGIVIPIALYQAVVWTGVYFLATRLPDGFAAAPQFFITLALTALLGGLLGLVASGLASSVQTGVAWALVLILPQLFFNGGTLPLGQLNPAGQIISMGMPARYAFEALVAASGYGRDVANDICWAMPEAQRQALTDTQKQQCSCTGGNIFSQCNFPGVRRFASPVLQQQAPTQPTPDNGVNNVPVQPVPAPGETLEQYVQDVNKYTLQMEIYHGSLGNYISGLVQYAYDAAHWQQQDSLVVGRAEGLLSSQLAAYGPIFYANLFSRWLVLLGICLILVVLFALVQKSKGVD